MTSENFKPAGKTSGFARPAVLCLLLVAVTLAVYWPAVHCDFLNFDDTDYFTANPHVQTGLNPANIIWAFTTRYASNWHPLTWLSLMLDAELFGKGPAGPHFTNLLFHLANAVLLFLLLRRLTAAIWRSAMVAALFALHPLHVESVAWIAERKDVLNTFFGLLSLLAYARHASVGEAIHSRFTFHVSRCYWLALLFFALGLMSKPMLVTLPLVMLLLDWWPLGRLSRVEGRGSRVRHLVLEKIPFFLLSAVSCVVTFIAQQKGGAITALTKISLSQRLDNAFVSYARYLGKTFWPVTSPFFIRIRFIGTAGWSFFRCAGHRALRRRLCGWDANILYVPVGWFWFVGTLVPVIGLVQVGIQSMADRYTYVPLIGLFLVVVWGLMKPG